jgi:hypothetical protein
MGWTYLSNKLTIRFKLKYIRIEKSKAFFKIYFYIFSKNIRAFTLNKTSLNIFKVQSCSFNLLRYLILRE